MGNKYQSSNNVTALLQPDVESRKTCSNMLTPKHDKTQKIQPDRCSGVCSLLSRRVSPCYPHRSIWISRSWTTPKTRPASWTSLTSRILGEVLVSERWGEMWGDICWLKKTGELLNAIDSFCSVKNLFGALRYQKTWTKRAYCLRTSQFTANFS